LIWLGISLFRTRESKETTSPDQPAKTARRAFLESVTVEVLNPKTALFFLAFLPQFVDATAAYPVWLQFVILGTIVNLIFSSADIVCVLMAGAILNRLRASSHVRSLMQRAGGTVLVGLGLHLAFQKS
jgi:threonine/homoserine/homoserine lactone efflux protein